MTKFLTCALALALAAGAARAADTYTLKVYKSKKGDKAAHAESESVKADIVADVGGGTTKQATASARKRAYTEEILEMKDGATRPTKLTRTYTVAEKTEQGETTKEAFAGQTVLIEKTADGYAFSIDGKAIEESDAPDLFRQFNDKKDDEPQTEDFLPAEAVAVGAVWKVPAAKSERMLNTLCADKIKIDAENSTIRGKLLKAYRKDGAQFGVVELTVTVIVTEIDAGGQFVKATAGSKMVLKGTIDMCVDGTVEFEDARMALSIDVTAEIPGTGSVTIQSTATFETKVSAVTK